MKLLVYSQGIKVDAVVSVGTGERTPSLDERIVDGDISWDNIVSQLIDSATSTTLIHDALLDLAPSDTYFRFSPASTTTPSTPPGFRYSTDYRKAALDYFGDAEVKFAAERDPHCAAALGL